ncbi:MAG: thiamine diphosphokinase [Bacteroidales bacterium]
MDTIKKYIILANGLFPTNKKVLSILRSADKIICCDNAIESLMNYKDEKGNPFKNANYIVGDLDSISEENKKKFNEILSYNPDQETNDLTKTVKFALELMHKENDIAKIYILSASGKREDHLLGNLSLLLDYGILMNCNKHIQEKLDNRYIDYPISLLTDYGVFYPIYNTIEINTHIGSYVSIFSNDESLNIKSVGLKYPVDSVIFNAWWKASLNTNNTKNFTLKFNHPSKVLLYIEHSDNQTI